MNEQGLCILAVEDSPHDAFLLRMRLSKLADAKFELLQVDRLSEALSLLSRRRVDLVLTDLNLPDSLGLDTVRTLVRTAAGVPVIVLFGCNTPEIGKQLSEAGACGHLSKDRLRSEELEQIIHAAVQRKAMPE
jgi:DNA-binding response OmpR family regulator